MIGLLDYPGIKSNYGISDLRNNVEFFFSEIGIIKFKSSI